MLLHTMHSIRLYIRLSFALSLFRSYFLQLKIQILELVIIELIEWLKRHRQEHLIRWSI